MVPLYPSIKLLVHQNKSQENWIERWAFTGNENADHSAQWSLLFPQDIHHKWRCATDDIAAARILRDQVHQSMIRVSEEAVSRDQPPAAADPPQQAYPLPVVETTIAALPRRPCTSTHKLVGDNWDLLTEWSNSLIHQQAAVVFVPFFYPFS